MPFHGQATSVEFGAPDESSDFADEILSTPYFKNFPRHFELEMSSFQEVLRSVNEWNLLRLPSRWNCALPSGRTAAKVLEHPSFDHHRVILIGIREKLSDWFEPDRVIRQACPNLILKCFRESPAQ